MKDRSNLFVEAFSIIPDLCVKRGKRHLLMDIIVIALCAVMSGVDQWIDKISVRLPSWQSH